MMRGILLLTLFIMIPLAQAASPADIERRVNEILSRMTLEEKLGQMSQSTSMRTPISDQIKREIREGRWGSFLNAAGPEERAEAQHIAKQESRLGIPLLFGRDVIHGYRTIFPIPLGQSSSWDTDLIGKAARIAAGEASSEGIRWVFSPMLDITRDPRWGRVAEGLGEDPYLVSVLGAAMVRGYQTEDLSLPAAVAACAKHFVGYGAAEAGREYNSTWIPENVLREVYLPPFRAAANAGVASFMTGFNALNGVPATANDFTLRQILRKEWNYHRLVVSDYTAIPELVEHGFATDPSDAARKALSAGIDMEMVSTTYFDHAKELIRAGRISIGTIDEAVRNILRLKMRLGLFDNTPQFNSVSVSPAALDVAERLAAESIVLLKNENHTLPLKKNIGTIAVLGPLADAPVDQMGTWVMDGRAEDVQTPLAALRKTLGNERVLYAPVLQSSRDEGHAQFESAIRTARSADVVLLFLGEEQILSGEAHSRAFLGLPGAQEALVSELSKLGKPLIAVVLAGRPLTIGSISAKVDGLLYAWHSGTMGGPAITSILFGDRVPSGKLTMTFPRAVGQIPIYYAHLNTGRPASVDQLGIPTGNPVNPTGYTSKYIDVDFTPEYPFGFGLSYTRFTYANLRVNNPILRKSGNVQVSADISNKGEMDADEVVQFYIHRVTASVARPVRELKGFQRVRLKAGETKRVDFALKSSDLSFYNSQGQLVSEPGRVQVWIAPDSVRGVEGQIRLE